MRPRSGGRWHGSHIQQIIGYLLIPSTTFRKFFVFLGEGANGKSTLIEVVVVMLGTQNVSHQSLHDLASGRFTKAELFGKLANSNADIESRDVKNSGVLKQLVAGDSIQFERKYRDPFSGPSTARLLFSAKQDASDPGYQQSSDGPAHLD
jgi:putative DNA primase/helicase